MTENLPTPPPEPAGQVLLYQSQNGTTRSEVRMEGILAVGYRVRSPRGTQFRIWATERLREYLVKGFTMDDDRLTRAGGGDYFEELLARIRDIRSSERVFWRKVLLPVG